MKGRYKITVLLKDRKVTESFYSKELAIQTVKILKTLNTNYLAGIIESRKGKKWEVTDYIE